MPPPPGGGGEGSGGSKKKEWVSVGDQGGAVGRGIVVRE